MKETQDWHIHYTDAKIGLLITMYDEVGQVAETMSRIGPGLTRALIVRSGEPIEEEWEEHFDYFAELPNLGGELDKWSLPAHAVCRNYAHLFSAAAKFDDVDFWVAITGDTVLLHLYGIEQIISRMTDEEQIAVCKAVGQDFHSSEWTLEQFQSNEAGGGRLQAADVPDFMPQMFIVRGTAVRDGLFHGIPIINPWTTEENLGAAFVDWIESRAEETEVCEFQNHYALEAEWFRDGILWHAEMPA